MKNLILASALVVATTAAQAEPVEYAIDGSHSQVVFSYDHQGWTPNYAMFGGIGGQIVFDADDPAASSVSVSFPVASMFMGDEKRKEHILSPDFFNADTNPDVTFVSTGIEVTGEATALITGDLTLNGMTKPVVLDASLNNAGTHAMSGKPHIGFSATTEVLRSDFGVDMFTPFVSDAVQVTISIEAGAD